MGRACCILGCPSGGDVPSHQIPRNLAHFQRWKSIIYSEKIQHLTDEQIRKCTVCYRHFADDDYLLTFRVRKLKRGVVPSLNLPNKPAFDINDTVEKEPQTSVASTGTFAMKERTEVKKEIETPELMKVKSETTRIELFEDTPEIIFCSFDQLQASPNEHTKQPDSTAKTFKPNRNEKMEKRLRKKQKLTAKQFSLLRCKQQAKQYEKTPTIQKLLSSLTPAEIASIKTRIQRSRYSPRIYVRIYHNVAQRKALDDKINILDLLLLHRQNV